MKLPSSGFAFSCTRYSSASRCADLVYFLSRHFRLANRMRRILLDRERSFPSCAYIAPKYPELKMHTNARHGDSQKDTEIQSINRNYRLRFLCLEFYKA